MAGVVGLVLAAGAGSRYGQPKAGVVIDGERLVDRAVRILGLAGCAPIVVVLGAWLGEVAGADIVVNEEWSSGVASSLRAGLERVSELECDRVIVSLVDLPGLTSAAVARMIAAPSDLAVATYSSARGHPVLMAREHWAPVSESVSGDEGARAYLVQHNATEIDLSDLANGMDLDQPGSG
jgi:CTP:molybdopterin cytidylyltransferase MocA